MGVTKFKADLQAASQKAAAGNLAGITSISPSKSQPDNEVIITFNHRTLPQDIRIHAVCVDASGYPDDNSFVVFTNDCDIPQPISDAITLAQDYLVGMSVYEMALELSESLARSFAKADSSTNPGQGSEDENDSAGEEFADVEFDVEEDDFFQFDDNNDVFGLPTEKLRQSQGSAVIGDKALIRQRMRRDLRQVREAGYKVGFIDCQGNDAVQGIVSISIRIDKLSIPDAAMEAWDVDGDDYLVLLIRFDHVYLPLERILERTHRPDIRFRVGKCKKYKPSPAQAHAVFTGAKRKTDQDKTIDDAEHLDTEDNSVVRFQKLFISNSLDQYLNESFVPLLRIRSSRSCSWEQANNIVLAQAALGAGGHDADALPDDVMDLDPEPNQESDSILAYDHLTESHAHDCRSFPLIAMQFAVRYFMRCTEFCLRCHRRLDKEFEALRPYVCEEPLCLFQYMAMGFGPSVEHEILTGPYVVDLLVSLCYHAVQPCAVFRYVYPGASSEPQLPIRSLPVGLRLQVPNFYLPPNSPQVLSARIIPTTDELLFAPGQIQHMAKCEGKWVAYRIPGQTVVTHGVVKTIITTSINTTLVIDKKAESGEGWGVGQFVQHIDLHSNSSPAVPQSLSPSTAGAEVEVFFYETDFDSLAEQDKGSAMRHVLDTLPSVLHMEDFLKAHPDRTVRDIPGVSPAAAALLQWIVSSNRSCIYQIDRCRPQNTGLTGAIAPTNGSLAPASALAQNTAGTCRVGRGRDREHERIKGMDGWVQFRFAQGSPDKEIRFNRALQDVANRKNIKANPTIFAWHGSALYNWHSIVRTGLDFEDVRCGRAFGNGVYFSHDYRTSIGYTSSSGSKWPHSVLAFGACISLNEIINAPEEFVSQTPHLVVAQPDWHQCRYLFVQSDVAKLNTAQASAQSVMTLATSGHSLFHNQPSKNRIVGPNGSALEIPLSAIPIRNVGDWGTQPTASMKRAISRLESDFGDDDDDHEDAKFLYSDNEVDEVDGPQRKRSNSRSSSLTLSAAKNLINPRPLTPDADKSLTDFEPGSLDLSGIPRLQPPSFANAYAARALAREIKNLEETQTKTPLHELGWHMDFGTIDNLFQWIVQLHSFDPSLPLARDMKAAGVTSIVLEIRFGKDYPMTPPFVRVVRPRFLPFASGGGGHVTAGGAMCMELLTNSGWSAANSMESVLLQVRMALCSQDPTPAKLQPPPRGSSRGYGDYGVGEAIEAYLRAVRQHGWEAPADLVTTANGV